MSVKVRARGDTHRDVFSGRMPRSGNTALAASALIQAALGIEFTLAALNKFADPNFTVNFESFVRASPGAHSGVLAVIVQRLVLPNVTFAAALLELIELGL